MLVKSKNSFAYTQLHNENSSRGFQVTLLFLLISLLAGNGCNVYKQVSF